MSTTKWNTLKSQWFSYCDGNPSEHGEERERPEKPGFSILSAQKALCRNSARALGGRTALIDSQVVKHRTAVRQKIQCAVLHWRALYLFLHIECKKCVTGKAYLKFFMVLRLLVVNVDCWKISC